MANALTATPPPFIPNVQSNAHSLYYVKSSPSDRLPPLPRELTTPPRVQPPPRYPVQQPVS